MSKVKQVEDKLLADYISDDGKLLWISDFKNNHYPFKILRDVKGNFWGFSDSKKIKIYQG